MAERLSRADRSRDAGQADHAMAAAAGRADRGVVTDSGTLLIVDDNATMCAALRTYMSRVAGWATIVTARDATAGLDLAATHRPTAIVLDNRMPPGRDGIELLADLRGACPSARIVMHTTEANGHLRELALRLGADAIVAKGRPLDELAALIRSA